MTLGFKWATNSSLLGDSRVRVLSESRELLQVGHVQKTFKGPELSTLSPLRMCKLLTLSSGLSPVSLRRTVFPAACICDLILLVTSQG